MTDNVENDLNSSKRPLINNKNSIFMHKNNIFSQSNYTNSPSNQYNSGSEVDSKKSYLNITSNLNIEEEKIVLSDITRLCETRRDKKLEETKFENTLNKTLDEKQMSIRRRILEKINFNPEHAEPDFDEKYDKKNDLTKEQLKLIECEKHFVIFFFNKI